MITLPMALSSPQLTFGVFPNVRPVLNAVDGKVVLEAKVVNCLKSLEENTSDGGWRCRGRILVNINHSAVRTASQCLNTYMYA